MLRAQAAAKASTSSPRARACSKSRVASSTSITSFIDWPYGAYGACMARSEEHQPPRIPLAASLLFFLVPACKLGRQVVEIQSAGCLGTMRNQFPEFPAARDKYAPDEHFLAELMQAFGCLAPLHSGFPMPWRLCRARPPTSLPHWWASYRSLLFTPSQVRAETSCRR